MRYGLGLGLVLEHHYGIGVMDIVKDEFNS